VAVDKEVDVPLITITRGSLSASRQVAEKISVELGCKIVTREEVLERASEFGLDETGMAGVDYIEKNPPHLWNRHAAERRLYLILIRASLLDFVAQGNTIYLGHMGQFVLSDVPKLLRIRVDASTEFRIRSLVDGRKFSEAEADVYIKRIDARRRSWAKFLYGSDYDSPHHYDMILNLERMSLDSAADVTLHAARRPEWEIDEETTKTIKNIHLASTVSARLVQSPRTRGMELAVECDSLTGRTKIRGMSPLIGTESWSQDIRGVVMGVEGITSVEIVDLR
jgi:cytidylate kinase